jgi:predicted nucleic acid-binding protein
VIVLDTNVLSELMRPEPHPAVFGWVAAQPRSSLYTTAINRAEVLYGIAALPAGRRKHALAAAAEAVFSEDLAGRILPFNDVSAVHYASLVMARREAGTPIEAFDALIAAATLAAGAGLATRDTGGFAGCGLSVVNPWDAT